MSKFILFIGLLFSLSSFATDNSMTCAIALERSTDSMAQILSESDSLDPEEWLTVIFVQDMSHLQKAPPIPGFLLTFLARKAFDKKISLHLGEDVDPEELPKFKKMYFSKTPEEFKGVSITLSAYTHIELKAKHLRPVVDWFVASMNHPALGNKVFKIDLK